MLLMHLRFRDMFCASCALQKHLKKLLVCECVRERHQEPANADVFRVSVI